MFSLPTIKPFNIVLTLFQAINDPTLFLTSQNKYWLLLFYFINNTTISKNTNQINLQYTIVIKQYTSVNIINHLISLFKFLFDLF